MATKKVFCSYQEIIDLHTESDKVTAIGFHVPDTDTPHKMFGGLYDQYKKVKYLGMSVSFVPVARLPVDPLGVSLDAGEPTMDPRDVVNPILIHGCHGNDMGTILNNLYSGQIGSIGEHYNTDSTDIFSYMNGAIVEGSQLDFTVLENLYYKALVDNTWQKAHPQKGFRKSGLHPMVYNVVANHQINPSLPYDAPDVIANTTGVPSGDDFEFQIQQAGMRVRAKQNVAFGKLHLMTNRLVPYGWLDTRNVITQAKNGDYVNFASSQHPLNEAMADLLDMTTTRSKFEPIYMMMCLLPPAYKTEQYFRCIINHSFCFAGFRGMSFDNSGVDQMPPSVFDLNDEMSFTTPSYDAIPVILLSNETSSNSSKYSTYLLGDASSAITLGTTAPISVSARAQTFNIRSLYLLDGKLYGFDGTYYYDFESMKQGAPIASINADFTVTDANGNSDLITVLQSGDYDTEVSS